MKEKSEDLNIQIQYKLVEELTRTNESLQEKIQQNKKQLDETRKLIKDLQIINNFSKVIQNLKPLKTLLGPSSEKRLLSLDLATV